MEPLDKNLDKEIRQSFAENQKEVPAELWDNISKRINNNNSSNFNPFYTKYIILTLVASLGIFGIVYYTNFSEKSESVSSENPIELPSSSAIEQPFEVESEKDNTSKNHRPSQKESDQLSETPLINNSERSVTLKSRGEGMENFELGFMNLKMLQVGEKYILQGLSDTTGFRIVAAPKNGKVSFDQTSKKFVYTPNKGFTGKDQFKYEILDVKGEVENEGTIKITVDKDLSSRASYQVDYLSANEVNLVNTSLVLPKDSNNFSFVWSFDNKEFSYNTNERRLYKEKGEYSICLILKANNNIDTFCNVIKVDSDINANTPLQEEQNVYMKKDSKLEIGFKNRNAGIISAERAQKKKDITQKTESAYSNSHNDSLSSELKKKNFRA